MASQSNVLGRVVCVLMLLLGLGAPVVYAAAPKKVEKSQAIKKNPARAHVVSAKPRQERRVASRVNTRRAKVERVQARGVRSRTLAVSPKNRVLASVQPSFGQLAGLNATADALGLKSNAVMVIDQETHKVLFNKNGSAVLPIASLTKLMTGLVVSDAGLPLDQPITITQDDVDTLKGSGSRLAVGTTLTRGELLHLALMSSENRAAHALGRTFPGGVAQFVNNMNAKAKLIGMTSTQFVDPTGLSPRNQSSAKDLATLVSVAYERPVIRDLSTSPSYEVDTGTRTLQYRNTNQLVNNPQWDIGLQKTGYISEAGRCLVMQATVAGRQLIMVFLDSAGKLTRIADAERVRRWLEAQPSSLF